ncbi:hypothetical protein CVU83_01675 [Candidatus Falkowbacteria bacterium HGW-Falkowbacteria-2]|uniref:GH26 domain-containing protein n=1 Tax=Candidatus Falkowbacteria bacterium HGW-Falkowbacteria-2 TaxID=2013769 RepID=A0A2N2E187_9BACT|nr:MAG: hypothetical protein CVU83_01675 [Candidatus Falkowbacteria bacterium HGW-Falkowbacteria-2]
MQTENFNQPNRLLLYVPVFIAAIIFFAHTLPQAIFDAQAADKFKIGDTVTVTTTSLNVRADAGTNARVLGAQKINSSGVITAGPKSANGFNWWQINYNSGIDGWSADSYLRLTVATPVAQPAGTKFKTQDRVRINTAALNVRSNAGVGSSILGTQRLNSTGTVVSGPRAANGYNWWQINYDLGTDGWSAEAFLDKIATAPAAGPGSSTSLLWGAYAGNNPGNLEEFERLVGKSVDIQTVFVGWNDPFPREIGFRLKRDGKTMLIFWEPYSASLEAINAGRSDEYIATFAAQAKEYGAPIIMSPLHEMNGNWNPWGGYGFDDRPINSPSLIIAVWKRMHDAFLDADNVKFAWAVNNVSVPNIPANAASVYYPGDAYVDYVGVDGFNFGNPWQDFRQVFDESMKEMEKYNKPIYLFSLASAPGPDKAEWIKEGLGTIIKQYPNIAGWVWFNQNGPDRNWTINSDTASLEAFKSIIP